ncbi:MAG: hypothetical protein ACM3QZ_08715 [Solirubrobacterales bacterium]
MSDTYNRRVSLNERAFLAMDRLGQPVVNQAVFESPTPVNPMLFKAAVEEASSANPGSRLVLKGRLAGCRWIDSGVTPVIREVDGSQWDGFGPDGAPFLDVPLDPVTGPTCEIVIANGGQKQPVQRIIFRTHHAVMDGRGTLFWAQDVFRAIRGLRPIGSHSALTDLEMARSIQSNTRKPYPAQFLAPTGKAEGTELGVTWSRVRLRGSFPNLLGQLSVLLAEEARRTGPGPFLYGIPVDMRRHCPDLTSTGNLTYSIYGFVEPEMTAEHITRDIRRQLAENREGMLSVEDTLLRYIPLDWIAGSMRRTIRKRHLTGQYSLSAILSNLGRIPLAEYSGGGFKAAEMWAIPPPAEYYPYFVVLAGYRDILNLTVSVPKVLATQDRVDRTMRRVVAKLRPDPAQETAVKQPKTPRKRKKTKVFNGGVNG